MLILVSGGAASGKSEYAEKLIVKSGFARRTYIATMQISDGEDERRAARHRAMRAGKNFDTLECPRDLSGVPLPQGGAVLLECMSNLAANEFFGGGNREGAKERILRGMDRLCREAELTVVVTNELFSDGIRYGDETEAYLAMLAALNRDLAERADAVVEVAAGIPIVWKGKEIL
ncbi:MAG: bifunctional adenosylcobinamide kinase/adenosylcobinamide-phosphate guanylyltransferase [Clostridiales bacterium]|nr:bifunctional adenosylcobinamide kinase/adenosylcobinamide-phosphate guanylyltransferase [Clostridiales bacterium]